MPQREGADTVPQNVPRFEWTDDALRLREFMFNFWFDNRRPPMLRDCHENGFKPVGVAPTVLSHEAATIRAAWSRACWRSTAE